MVGVGWLVEEPGVAGWAALAHFDEPLLAERQFEHFGGEVAQETGVGYLAAVALDGLALEFTKFGDVYLVRDVCFGFAHGVAVVGWVVGVEVFAFGNKLHEALPVVAVHGHFKHVFNVCDFGRAVANVMHLDVVGVAIVAVPVVGGEDVGLFFFQDGSKLLCGNFGVGVDEGVGGFVLFPTCHAAVVVTQPHQTVHAKHVAGCFHFFFAEVGGGFAGRKVGWCFAVVAICGNNNNYAVAFFGCAGKCAAHGQAFVVGVGVKRNEGAHLEEPSTTAPLASNSLMLLMPHSLRICVECWPACAGGVGVSGDVREKRGAGAGCVTPAMSMKVLRAM